MFENFSNIIIILFINIMISENNSFIVRESTKQDMESVLNMIKKLAEFEKELKEVENTVEQLIEDGFGNDPKFKCIVADRDNKTVGFALYCFHYSTWKGNCLYLEDIFVEEESRGIGIGKALFQAIINISKKLNVKRMMWQVLDWNQKAIDFYQNFDAEFVPNWVNVKFTYDKLKNL